MSKKLYVGNLSFNATEEQVREFFGKFGEILSVKIITDRETGKSRGFCFVEMENADAALAELNGKEMDGRKINVSEAREREQRPFGGNRGGGGSRDYR